MKFKKTLYPLIFISAIFFIYIKITFLKVLSLNNNSKMILIFTLLSLLSDFIFSVVTVNIITGMSYSKIVKKNLYNFFHSSSFHVVSKGEFLQNAIDFPQNFMFIYSTLVETIALILIAIIAYIIFPKDVKLYIALIIPFVFIILSIFAFIRKNESHLFLKSTESNRNLSTDFLDFINGMTDLQGINAEDYIKEKIIRDKKVSSTADSKFSFNQYLQKNIFSYSAFLPIYGLLICHFLFPEELADTDILKNTIVISNYYSLIYRTIINLIELKLYNMYKKKIDTWNNSLIPLHQPVKECEHAEIAINAQTSIFVRKFSINKNDFIQLHGKSGKGKTCYIEYILGLRNAKNENIIALYNERISYVGQKSFIFEDSFWNNLLAERNEENKKLVQSIWDSLGLQQERLHLENEQNIKPKLSSGQEIIVFFTRAILNKPKLIVLDEFDKNLSADISHKLIMMAKDYCESIIFVSHEQENFMLRNKDIYL